MIDPDPDTFQINPDKMEAKIGPYTKAILPVHILGLPAHMDKINTIARKHNLVVVEDACQAWLAEWKGKKCGTLGDLGCFSFQNSKNLPCGEGGAIVGTGQSQGTFLRTEDRGLRTEKANQPCSFAVLHPSSVLCLPDIDSENRYKCCRIL